VSKKSIPSTHCIFILHLFSVEIVRIVFRKAHKCTNNPPATRKTRTSVCQPPAAGVRKSAGFSGIRNPPRSPTFPPPTPPSPSRLPRFGYGTNIITVNYSHSGARAYRNRHIDVQVRAERRRQLRAIQCAGVQSECSAPAAATASVESIRCKIWNR